MASIISTSAIIMQPIILTIALVHIYGLLSQRVLSKRWRLLSLGMLFGVGAIASMSMPITIAEGLIFDLRNLLIGAAAGLLGPAAGVIALAVGLVTRTLIGGFGAMSGVYGMLLATGAGLLWHYMLSNRIGRPDLRFMCLGAMVSTHLLAAYVLPQPFQNFFLFEIGPFIILCNVLGAWTVGRLMMHENKRHKEVNDLRMAAETDPLTNLMNRRSLASAVEKMSNPEQGAKGRVMLCFDLDCFKAINDEYGHLAGDKVLREVSARVRTCLRPKDIFSRLGGDEFAVILPDISRDAAKIVAERCRAAINAAPVEFEDRSIPVSISMGASWTDAAIAFDEFLQTADEALYASKRQGRNRVSLHQSFNPSPHQSIAA